MENKIQEALKEIKAQRENTTSDFPTIKRTYTYRKSTAIKAHDVAL
jgi:hypothetical protein